MDALDPGTPSAHDLMPLEMAAAMVFRRVYEERKLPGLRGTEARHLDGLAYTIAELAAVYIYDTNGSSLRRLSDDELRGALFQDGAKRISYVDGRKRITNLAVSIKEVEAVIGKLIAAFTAAPAAPVKRRGA